MMERKTECLFSTSNAQLWQKSLRNVPRIGDHIKFDHLSYEVMGVEWSDDCEYAQIHLRRGTNA